VAGSLKRRWVTASPLISKLQSYPRKNRQTRALQEYVRLSKAIVIRRYRKSEVFRRRINTQLNKREALQWLREFLLFANKVALRKRQVGELMNRAAWRRWPTRREVEAGDLALSWDAVVAQIGILRSGSGLHFQTTVRNRGGQKCKGRYPVPISGN
jgi:hypothetical protein